jgi:hypothetical protein
MASSVLQVGDGRGFVVARRDYIGHMERIVITAAHCLPDLPPPHPARDLAEETYERLLAPLGSEPVIYATCLFVDPIADIAAFGPPDDQELSDEAHEYEKLLDEMEPLVISDAPAEGSELLTFGDTQVERPTPGQGSARVLSLDGKWSDGHVIRRGFRLDFQPEKLIVAGMSGSPIVSLEGKAMGVVSTARLCPVLMDTLAPWLLRSIIAAACG